MTIKDPDGKRFYEYDQKNFRERPGYKTWGLFGHRGAEGLETTTFTVEKEGLPMPISTKWVPLQWTLKECRDLEKEEFEQNLH